MEYNVVDNKERSRFEVSLNGEYAFVDYRWHKRDLPSLTPRDHFIL